MSRKGDRIRLARLLCVALVALALHGQRLAAQPPAPTPGQVRSLREKRLHAAVVAAPAGLSVDITNRAESRAFFNAVYLASKTFRLDGRGPYRELRG